MPLRYFHDKIPQTIPASPYSSLHVIFAIIAHRRRRRKRFFMLLFDWPYVLWRKATGLSQNVVLAHQPQGPPRNRALGFGQIVLCRLERTVGEVCMSQSNTFMCPTGAYKLCRLSDTLYADICPKPSDLFRGGPITVAVSHFYRH